MRHLTTFRMIDEVARAGSLRRAAQAMAITPSALQRRVQTFEEELGFAVFERLARGVRPSAAGEIVLHHIRQQLAETDRLRSRLADLSGVRRGHVSIACSQALTTHFLPAEIACYRAAHPAVSFEVHVLDHEAAVAALIDYEADIALVYGGERTNDLEVVLAVPQDICAVMARAHPLAHRETLRLREVLRHPLALPTRAFTGRRLLDRALAGGSTRLTIAVESNSFELLKSYVRRTDAITLQVPVGSPTEGELDDALVGILIDSRDIHGDYLYLAQLKGRTLSVASSRFTSQVSRALVDRFGPAS